MQGRDFKAWDGIRNSPGRVWLNKARRILVVPILVLALSTLFLGTIFVNPTHTQAATVTWDGGGTDGTCGGGAGDGNKWSCAANWTGDALPQAADTAQFDNTSDKSVTVDTNISIASITTVNGYEGTMTVGVGVTLTLTSGLTIGAGNIELNGRTIDVASLTQTGGTVTDTAGGGQITVSGTVTGGGGSWTGGSLVFDGSANQNWEKSDLTNWYNVIVNNTGDTPGTNDLITYNTDDGRARVSGNFTFTDGTINNLDGQDVSGNLIVGANASGGSSIIFLSGTGDQEINFTGAGAAPNITIYKNSGNVTVNAASNPVKVGASADGSFRVSTTGTGKFDLNGRTISASPGGFYMTTGSVDLSGGTVDVGSGYFNYAGGDLDLDGGLIDVRTFTQGGGTVIDTAGGGQVTVSNGLVTTSGRWNAGTLVLNGTTNQSWQSTSLATVFYDVVINNTGATPGTNDMIGYSNIYTFYDIRHNLTLLDGTLGSTGFTNFYADVDGNISVGANASGGDGTVYLTSGGNHQFNYTGAGAFCNVSVRKSSGNTTINGASNPVKIGATGDGTFEVVSTGSGKVDLGGRTIDTSTGTFTLTSGSLDLNGGTIDTASFTHTAGTVSDTAGGGQVTASGTVTGTSGTWSAGTLVFDGDNVSQTWNSSTSGTAWYDVVVNKTGATYTLTAGSISYPNITRNLTLTDGSFLTNMRPTVDGNVSVGLNFSGGVGYLYFDGTGDQELSITAGGVMPGYLYINKASGVASLAAASANLVVPTRLDITLGIFYANGKSITVTANTFSNTGTLRVQGGETLTFTRDTDSGIVEYVGDGAATTYATLNYGNTHFSAKFNSTSGTNTWQLGANQVVNGDLTVTAGIFDVNNWTATLNGNTLINGGIMMTGTGVNTFGNAASDTVTISSGELKIESDVSTTDIVKTAGTWTNSGGTINYNGAGATSTILLSALSPYYNLKVDSAGSTYTLNGNITISNDNNITNGTLDASATNYNIYIAGDWTNNGTFTARNGLVQFVGADSSTQEINGTTTFYNLRARTSGNTAGRTLQFAGSTTTNATNWQVFGYNNKLITLKSSDANSWTINPATSADVSYADVTRSTNSGVAFCARDSTDSNFNTNWNFACAGAGVTVSGTIYTTEDKLSNIGAGHTIGLTLAGKAKTTVSSGAGGTFSFAAVTVAANDPMAIFVDDDATYEATMVTQALDNASNITGLEMYTNKIVIRHESAGPIDNALLGQAKASGETDIHYSTSYTPVQTNVSFDAGFQVWIGASMTYAPGGDVTIGGSYKNSGTFTAGTYLVTFNSTSAGETLSGRLNNAVTTSAFYKLAFNGIGGAWTIQDAIYATAANATDTFVVGNGTVTLGDGNGDNLEVDGKMTIAATADQTGTFQTYANTEGSSIVVQINKDTTTQCANCIISVGATSGAGQGNLKLRKNTIVKLFPKSTATASDAGIEAESTGYLEIQGSQDYTGTSNGTTDETTVTDTTKAWVADENNNKAVRMTSGLAYGQVYDITDTTATTLVRADNSSVTETSPTVGGAGPTRTLTLTTQSGIVVANNDHLGRYVHNLVTDTYYKIVDSAQVGAGTDTLTIIAEPAADFTQMSTNDDIKVTDGVRQNDTYEVLDYAIVRAESDTCAATINQSGEAYINSKAGSESLIRYADICNLGRAAAGKDGLEFTSVNGANASEGFTVDKSKVRSSYYGILSAASSFNAAGKGITNSLISGLTMNGIYLNGGSNTDAINNRINTISGSHGVYLNTSTKNNLISGNYIYAITGNFQGIYLTTGCPNNTVQQNKVYLVTYDGIYVASNDNLVLGNIVFGSTSRSGISLNAANANLISANEAYANNTASYANIYITGGTKNTIRNSKVYASTAGSGFILINTTYNTFFGNQSYANVNGLYALTTAATNNVLINESYGATANTTADINFGAQVHNLRLFNTTLASSTEVSGATTANAYVASFKHDGTAGSTKIWNDYAFQTDSTETIQDETTNKFNYADDSWANSFISHGFNVGGGAGTEDTDLNYAISGSFGGDASVYSYFVTCAIATCSTGTADAWNVYRNGTLLTDKAVTGTTYTDDEADGGSAPNIQFKIDQGAVAHTQGATYLFSAYKAAGDTNTTKTVAMMQDADTFVVASGKTLQSIGDATHKTAWTKGGGAGTGYNIAGAGTFNINYSTFDYLKGASGIDIQAGATVTDLSNTTFDNLVSAGAVDAYINVASTVIGTGLKTFTADTFNNTGATAEFNVNRTGSDDIGNWDFPGAAGALAGEAFDGKAGVNEADPGMLTWDDSSSAITISGTCKKYDQSTNCADAETIKVAINGTPDAVHTGTTGTGAWTITNVTPASGDVITVWVDGVADGLEANAVTKYDGAGNIFNVNLFEEHLSIGSGDAATVTNAVLSTYDNSVSANEDIFFDVDANNDLTVDAITQSSQEELYIAASNTYRPDSGNSGNITTHDLENAGTLLVDNNTIYMGGSWLNSATFTASGSTVDFNGAAGTDTLNSGGTGAGKAFWNLIHSGAGTVQLLTNALDIENNLTNSAGTLDANNLAISINGNYSNSGTFTAGTGTVTFDATDAGNTLSGRLDNSVTSSAFYKVVFSGVGASWTIQDAMYVTAASATDTFVINNGTVTLGDGAGDNLEVDGQMKVANSDGQTATFQTASVDHSAGTITVQMNKDTTTTCVNCKISVGASTGAGQGNFKLRKNSILKLIPKNVATISDAGLEIESTGYLEVQGSQDYTGTSTGTTDETTLTDGSKTWTDDENNNKSVRITNTDSLAYGNVYTITDTTATTLVRADNSTADSTITSFSGAASTRKICVADLISANDQQIGRYFHDKTHEDYFKVVDTVNDDATCVGTDDSITVIAEPAANFASLANADTFDISDGVRVNDTYEVLDYASVTAENGTACGAAPGGAGEAYAWAKGGSESLIQYGQFCNLGRSLAGKYGVTFDTVNGANSNEGLTVNKSSFYNNYRGIFLTASSNNSSSKGIADNIFNASTSAGIYLGAASNENELKNNNVYSNAIGLAINASHRNIATNNRLYNATTYLGNIYLINARNNSVTANDLYGSFAQGGTGLNENGSIYLGVGVQNNTFSANNVFGNFRGFSNDWVNATGWNYISQNKIYANAVGYDDPIVGSNVFYQNDFYENTTVAAINGPANAAAPTSNSYFNSNRYWSNGTGLQLREADTDISVYGVSEDFGTLGANTYDFSSYDSSLFPPLNPPYYLYNSNFNTVNFNRPLAIISKGSNNVAGATKFWGSYSIPNQNIETPQDETIEKYNYADRLWGDSFAPHKYYGTGTNDANLDYAVNGSFGGAASSYVYKIVCAETNCVTTPNSWSVYRNDVLLSTPASTGTTYTDSQADGGSAPNLQFKIDDAGTDYAEGDTYYVMAWKASNDTNTTKTIEAGAPAQHFGDIMSFNVGAGKTFESVGTVANPTAWDYTTYRYHVVSSGGSVKLQYSNFHGLSGKGNFIGAFNGHGGIDLQAGTTLVSMDHLEFDYLEKDRAYIGVDSSVIGSGNRTFDEIKFLNSDCFAIKNVNRYGSDDVGYWYFPRAPGPMYGERLDSKDMAPETGADMLRWDALPGTISGESDVDPEASFNCAALAVNGVKVNGYGARLEVGKIWTMDNTTLNANDVVTVWFDNGVTSLIKSMAVTQYDGTGDVTGVITNANTLTIGSDDHATISTTELGSYDYADDDWVFLNVSGNDYTIDHTHTMVNPSPKLVVLDQNRLELENTKTLYGYDLQVDGELYGQGSAVFNGNVNGIGLINLTGGSFTQRIDGVLKSFGPTGGSSNWTFNNLKFETSTAAPLIYLASNGLIDFDGQNLWDPQAPPDDAAPNGYMAGFWEDLNFALGGTLKYKTIGAAPNRKFVVEYANVQPWGGGDPINFQIQLYEGTNIIEMHYQGTLVGTDVTIGLEDLTGTRAVVDTSAGAVTKTNEAIRYTPVGSSYTMSATALNWADLTSGATEVILGNLDEGVSAGISLPFGFSFFGSPGASVEMSTGGTHDMTVNGTLTVGNAADAATVLFSNSPGDRNFDVNSVDITSKGELLASNKANFTVAGDWNNLGWFSANDGTVRFDGADASTQHVTGNTTFHDFVASSAANTVPRTMQFGGNSTQTFNGSMTFTGFSGKRITLQSTDSNDWIINPSAASATYVDVAKSVNIGVYFCATYSIDQLNNTDWDITLTDTCGAPPVINVPDPPTVTAVSTTELNVVINENGNPPSTQYAISCDADGTFLNYSTNACEAIADDADHWRTKANWGGGSGFGDTGLGVNTQHTYKVKARGVDLVETALSGPTSRYTFIEPITDITWGTIATNAIELSPTNTPSNLASGNSGIQYCNATNTFCSAWQQNVDSWTSNGLTPNNQYTFTIQSRNGDSVTTTPYQESKYTLANVPNPPTVNTPSASTVTVIINQNANPAYTLFTQGLDQNEDGNIDAGGYLQDDGSFGVTPVWQTKADWGGDSGLVVPGLDCTITYKFRTKAENNDTPPVETAWSGIGSDTTLACVAPAVTVQPADTITEESAVLYGTIVDTGGEDDTRRGFQVYLGGTCGGEIVISPFEDGVFGLGGFTLGVSALTEDTLYSYIAYAVNTLGTTISPTCESFRTVLGATDSSPGTTETATINVTVSPTPHNFPVEVSTSLTPTPSPSNGIPNSPGSGSQTPTEWGPLTWLKDMVVNRTNMPYYLLIFLVYLIIKMLPVIVNWILRVPDLFTSITDTVFNFLQYIGIRKKKKPWGVVFDAKTGRPVPLATIRVVQGEGYRKILDRAVSDKDGRYGFLTKLGSFYLSVTKNGYQFPAKIKPNLYEDEYFGETFKITTAHQPVAYNIPIVHKDLDLNAVTWSIIIRIVKFLQRFRIPLLIVGTFYTSALLVLDYQLLYLLSIMLYACCWTLEYLLWLKPKAYGQVMRDRKPIEMAIVRLFRRKDNRLIATDVTDAHGRFLFLVDAETYYFSIIKPGYELYQSKDLALRGVRTMLSVYVELKPQISLPPKEEV